MKKLGWVLIALVAGLAVFTVHPQWFSSLVGAPDLTTVYPFTQFIALRNVMALVFLVLAVFMLAWALISRLARFQWVVIAKPLALGLVFLLVAGWQASFSWQRGTVNYGRLSPDKGISEHGDGDGSITVLTYNTLGGATTVQDIAQVMAQNGVDVAVLPETSLKNAQMIANTMEARGVRYQVFARTTGEEKVKSTALLVSDSLGEYRKGEPPKTRMGSVRAVPVNGKGPEFVGVHPVAPVTGLTEIWHKDLLEVMENGCGKNTKPATIMAGDFNATLDHGPLRNLGRCADGAVATNVGGQATWPVNLPAWLGATIDHVFYDKDAYDPVEGAVVETGKSDHRGVLVRLKPRAAK